MKNLITCIFAIITTISFSQFSRNITFTEGYDGIVSGVCELNSETYFINIRESANDTLKMIYGKIDEYGNTSDYQRINYPGINTTFASVSGFFSHNNELILVLVAQVANPGSLGKLSYIKFNPISNSITSVHTLSELFKRSYFRTVKNGDSLVTYTTTDPAGIKRIATSISDNSQFSEQVIDPSTSFTSSFSNYRIATDVLVNNGEEYAYYFDKLVHRNSSGAINIISSGIPPSPYGVFCIGSNGNLVFQRATNFEIYDASLNLLSSGTNSGIVAYSSVLIPISNGYRLYSNYTGQGQYIDFDLNMNTITTGKIHFNKAYSVKFINNMYYISGAGYTPYFNTQVNGLPSSLGMNPIMIIGDNGIDPPMQFIEFNQEISSQKFKAHSGHLGIRFNDDLSNMHGLQYNQNNLDRPITFLQSNSFVGKNTQNELRGHLSSWSSPLLPGPFTNSNDYSIEEIDKYSRGYFVSRDMIEDHLTNIGLGNTSYVIPFGIAQWPAHGNTSIGQAANIAPFVDKNNNGIYDPENGDYPEIYGTHCILNVYHQSPNSPESASTETHDYLFFFDCDTSEVLLNTVFNKTITINRGASLDSVYYSTFNDYDLGFNGDDFVGTNVELGLTYVYNGDSFDEANGGFLGFNDTIPAVGTLTLKGAKQKADGLDNAYGVGTDECINGVGFGDAIVDNEYYTLETSFAAANTSPWGYDFMDIQGLYQGGQGYYQNGLSNTIGAIEVKYSYLGQSDPLFYASGGVNHGNNDTEALAGNFVGDRRMYGFTGPTELATNDTLENINVVIVGVDTVNLHPDSSVVRLFELSAELKNSFALNSLGCGFTFDTYVSENDASINENELNPLSVYPNPSDQLVTIENIGIGNSEIKVVDINGRIVLSTDSTSDEVQLDVSQFVNGIYIIRVANEYGVRNVRFVKK